MLIAWLFMDPMGLGLNGYAYGTAIAYVGQMVTLYLYMFKYQKVHKKYWFGWERPSARPSFRRHPLFIHVETPTKG